MPALAAWSLFGLGVLHVVFGLVRFRSALQEAVAAGFVGKFAEPEVRRTAFWFLMAGPLLMAMGHVAVFAAETSDRRVFTTIGVYLLVSSGIGVVAFPKSPLWSSLLLGVVFLFV